MMNMIIKNMDRIIFSSAGKFIGREGSIHPRRKLVSAVLLVGCGGCYPIAQDGREYMLCDGTYLLLFPWHEHYGTAPGHDGQSHYWCHFCVPEDSVEFSDESAENGIWIPEFGNIINPDRIKLLFHQLIDSSERDYRDDTSRARICGIYVSLILSELYENALEVYESVSESAKKKQKSVSAKVKEYLRIHARENIGVTDLSKIFHYNPDYLTQIFKEEYGNTICTYINLVRIDEAKKLLIETDMKIGDVALNVGFYDGKYFMKTFKKIVGVTPSEFRQSHYRVHMNIR